MKQRAITAVFFVLAMLAGIYGGKVPFFLLCLTIVCGALWELMHLLLPAAQQSLTQRGVGLLLGAVPFALFGWQVVVKSPDGDAVWPIKTMQDGLLKLAMAQTMLYLFAFVILAFFLLLLSELFQYSQNAFHKIGHYLVGFFYVSVPFIALASIATEGGRYCPNRVLGLLLLTWTNDTMAYVVGSKIGKTRYWRVFRPARLGKARSVVCFARSQWADFWPWFFPTIFPRKNGWCSVLSSVCSARRAT